MLWDQLYEISEALLTAGPDMWDVRKMDDELVSEDSIKQLARRIGVKPAVIVAVGDPEITDYDTTGEITTESYPLEVIVAVSNRKSKAIQLAEARQLTVRVRQLMQGHRFTTDDSTQGIFRLSAAEHLGTSDNLTLYAVMFNVEVNVSITGY